MFAGPSQPGWDDGPYTAKLQEPLKETPSVLNGQMGAGGRAGRDLICPPRRGPSTLQPPPRSLEEAVREKHV